MLDGNGGGPDGYPSLPGLDIRHRRLTRGEQYGSFDRHEGETGGFWKVGRDEEFSSSNRAEHAAACIVLENAIRYASSQRPLLLLADSECFLMAIQKWTGEGIDLIIKKSPDGDILREILELLRNWIELGLFTQPNFSREKGTSGRSLEISAKTNESVSEPSAASFKELASSSRAPWISRNVAGRKRTNADYVSPFTRSSLPSWSA